MYIFILYGITVSHLHVENMNCNMKLLFSTPQEISMHHPNPGALDTLDLVQEKRLVEEDQKALIFGIGVPFIYHRNLRYPPPKATPRSNKALSRFYQGKMVFNKMLSLVALAGATLKFP